MKNKSNLTFAQEKKIVDNTTSVARRAYASGFAAGEAAAIMAAKAKVKAEKEIREWNKYMAAQNPDTKVPSAEELEEQHQEKLRIRRAKDQARRAGDSWQQYL